MQIINFVTNATEAQKALQESLQENFNPDTLVINDTRLMIIPHVLPHIPFVGGYDQRILPILENTTVIFSKPFSELTHTYYNSLGLAKDVEVLEVENTPEITLTENILQNAELINQLKK